MSAVLAGAYHVASLCTVRAAPSASVSVLNAMFFRTLISFIALAFWSATASAALVLPMELAEMARESDEVVLAEVVAAEGFLDGGRVMTRVTLLQSNDYRRATTEARYIEVIALGGVLGDIATVVPGAERWVVGSSVVAFLRRDQRGQLWATALSQSLFTIDFEATVPSVERRLDGVMRGYRGVELPAQMPLDRLEATILDALSAAAP